MIEKKNQQKALFKTMTSNMSLNELQKYLKNIFTIRGFDKDDVEAKMLLLIEEVGELAKAIRKEKSDLNIDYSRIENYDSVKGELADVLIVLISISNLVDVDLYEAIYEKEKINIERRWEK